MTWTRRFRKDLTVRILNIGFKLAQTGSRDTVERMRTVLCGFCRAAYPLRSQLKINISNAGLYHDGLIDAYFEHATDQLIMLAHIARAGLPKSGCMERFEFDDSFQILKNAYSKGKGVIIIAPHICGYPIYGGIVSSRIPCVIYLRHNKDTKKMSITTAIAQAGGAELVYPPENAADNQKLTVALDVLRRGKVMFITPDTPRKPHQGVEVSILGKKAYFPIGVFVMSLRTGAPVVPTWWHSKNGVYRISYSEPIGLNRGGNIKAKAGAAAKKWAADVDKFLREHPEMWWNWLDKRWTQILRN